METNNVDPIFKLLATVHESINWLNLKSTFGANCMSGEGGGLLPVFSSPLVGGGVKGGVLAGRGDAGAGEVGEVGLGEIGEEEF